MSKEFTSSFSFLKKKTPNSTRQKISQNYQNKRGQRNQGTVAQMAACWLQDRKVMGSNLTGSYETINSKRNVVSDK